MDEVWKQVVAYPDYWVSNMGRVKSAPSRPHPNGRGGKLLKPFERRNKYGRLCCLCVNLVYARRRYRTMRVHRLVLEAFIGACPDGHECCHFDGNPANNNLSNLRWDTKAGNQRDLDRHGTRSPPPVRRGVANNMSKLSEEAVQRIRRLGCAADAKLLAAEYGVSRKTIYCVRRGQFRADG